MTNPKQGHVNGEIDDLKKKVLALEGANKKPMEIYGKDIFMLTPTIEDLKKCNPHYAKAEFPLFPLRIALADLLESLANLETHLVLDLRVEVQEILAPWTTVQQREQSHP